MFEQWRDIPGYEGHYQAANTGRVRSSPGRLIKNNGFCGDTICREKILKPIIGRDGRERITLSKETVIRTYLLSRVVAMTWVNGYTNHLTVNHINGDKRDNRASNLEWVTRADNIRHGYNTGLYRKKQIGVTIKNLFTGDESRFCSLAEASRHLGKTNGYLSNYIKRHGSLTLNGLFEYEKAVTQIELEMGK